MSTKAKGLTGLTALAIVAHPDDIEFYMAGTLLRLGAAGVKLHLWNLCNGHCGTAVLSPEEIVKVRWAEAQASAAVASATMHPPITEDIALFHHDNFIRLVCGKVRQVKPNIILTQAPYDYMEDHMNASRLAVTGAFCRGMKNYPSTPAVPIWDGPVCVYHATPHGLRDPLRRLVRSELYVDIGDVLPQKRAMLACHKSQKEWLDVSQGMDAYLTEMEKMSRAVGQLSARYVYAEGWRRHSHLGFAAEDYDPLSAALAGQCFTDARYVAELG